MDKKCVKLRNYQNQQLKNPVDLSQCLPPDLYDRVFKIINVPCGKDDPFEDSKRLTFKDLLMELDPNLIKKLDTGVTEENFADIVEKYQHHKSFEVKIKPRIAERKLLQIEVNWIE